jgi:hypothetical protein
VSDHLRTYGARPYGFKAAPKPANFDALTAAAAARDEDTFAAEHGKYRDQAGRAGVHPGTLLGVLNVLNENGDVA